MSTKTTTQDKNVTPAQERKGLVVTIRGLIADEARAALGIGIALLQGAATFTQADPADAFRSWATTATGKSWKTCTSYMAVARTHNSLNVSQQKKVAGWTFEAQQAVASVPEEDRKAVLSGIGGTNPTPETVREVRDNYAASKLTEKERKEQAAAKKTREREQAAEKTVTLAGNIQKDVVKGLNSSSVRAGFLAGAKLAQAYSGQDVVTAIEHLLAQADKAQAEKERTAKKDEAAGKALAAIKESRTS